MQDIQAQLGQRGLGQCPVGAVRRIKRPAEHANARRPATAVVQAHQTQFLRSKKSV
jgi:hypothetical protein